MSSDETRRDARRMATAATIDNSHENKRRKRSDERDEKPDMNYGNKSDENHENDELTANDLVVVIPFLQAPDSISAPKSASPPASHLHRRALAPSFCREEVGGLHENMRNTTSGPVCTG